MIYSMNLKAVENRLRRTAERRGYRLVKCARRDEAAIGFNTWTLVDISRPQNACADPARGKYNERFERVVLEGVPLEEVAKKLGVRIEVEYPKVKSADEILADQKSYLAQS
jgi:hypothetical protein